MKPKTSPTTKTGAIVELTIESLAYFGGRGVGRHEGLVVFVPGTAPGDRVRARISAVKPRFLEAELQEILTPGPGRRKPPCPVAGRCGGCSWQHVDYSVQIEQKQKILADSLRKLSKTQEFRLLPFLPAPSEFHYRNRIQLQVDNGRRGFFAARTRELVEFEECWIADERLNDKMQKLSSTELAHARRLELAMQMDGAVAVMAGERDPEVALFSQVNTEQNENLIAALLAAVDFEPEWIVDLYCGAGNLTLPLAERFPNAKVTGVELSRASIERAKRFSSRIDWRAADVSRELAKLEPGRGRGLVVLDPPRIGCDSSVMKELARLNPTQIVYVSCNPSTFARDAERLLAEGGFRVESVQGLDMFPQTEHVELICSLRAATLLPSEG